MISVEFTCKSVIERGRNSFTSVSTTLRSIECDAKRGVPGGKVQPGSHGEIMATFIYVNNLSFIQKVPTCVVFCQGFCEEKSLKWSEKVSKSSSKGAKKATDDDTVETVCKN